MTELEKMLLQQFKQMQSDNEAKHNEFKALYSDLAQMYERTKAENEQIREHLNQLEQQLTSLNRLLKK